MTFVTAFVFVYCLIVLVSGNESASTASEHYETIVVGLGSSGVTAASTLASAGKRVLGLEAQDRIGGRVNTVPFGDGVVELGAEWIHGERPSRVYDLAVKNNVTIMPQEFRGEAYRSDGTPTDQALVNELIMYALDVFEQQPEKPESVGQFVTRKLMDYIRQHRPEVLKDQDFVTEFLEFLNLLINNYEASNDWNDVSTFSKYEDLDGNQHLSWHKYGYKTFFEILLNKYKNGPGLPTLETKLNTEVTKIVWPQDPNEVVVVTCKDGSTYRANNVIVTVSLGVLKERHTTLFSPQLPQDKVTAIEKISIGVVDKIILSFSEKWWPTNLTSFGFIWRGEDKKKLSKEDYWITRIYDASTPMGSKNSLTFWTSGDVAKLVETLPEDVVKSKTMELVRKFMGAKFNIPEPTGIIRSSWYTNPYTRGSYSYNNHIMVQYPEARNTLARPLTDEAGNPRVLFAGEATNQIHYSTVHGASETGYREAMRLIQLKI